MHELVQKEISRQNRDYEIIKSLNSPNKVWVWFYEQERESILNSYWFNENFVINSKN